MRGCFNCGGTLASPSRATDPVYHNGHSWCWNCFNEKMEREMSKTTNMPPMKFPAYSMVRIIETGDVGKIVGFEDGGFAKNPPWL